MNQKAFDLVLSCLEHRIYDICSTGDSEYVNKHLTDMKRFGTSVNIASITESATLRNIIQMMENEEYYISRLDFLMKTMHYLKMQLGADGWNTLLDDIVGSFQIIGSGLAREERDLYAGFSQLNNDLAKLNRVVLECNHWLVPLILLGIHPATLSTINHALMTYNDAFNEQFQKTMSEDRKPSLSSRVKEYHARHGG